MFWCDENCVLSVGKNHYIFTVGHNMFFTLQTVFSTLTFHFQFSILHLTKPFARVWFVLVLHKLSSRTGNGGSPYGNLPTTTMLRSGGICFGIAQTFFTNWERRLAIWKFTNHHNATLGQNMFWHCTNYLHELGTAARRAVAINSKI